MSGQPGEEGAAPEPATPGNSDPKRVLAHLDPWKYKPGQSGNPNGRPKDRGLRTILARVLEHNDGEVAASLVKNLLEIAGSKKKQSVRATSLIFDQYEPPMAKQLDVTTTARVVIQGSKIEKPPEFPPEVGEMPT